MIDHIEAKGFDDVFVDVVYDVVFFVPEKLCWCLMK